MSSEFTVVFALFPRITQLDFTGPYEVFARLPGARCLLASTEGGTIQADGGIAFSGVARLADIAPAANNGLVELADRSTLGSSARFYRLVTPGIP